MAISLQYTVQLDLPAELAAGFPVMLDKVHKHIIRQSIRSAILPARNLLKSKLMSLPRNSKQSSGATLRALTSKYAQSKSDPNRFYGIIGINRKAFETIAGPGYTPFFKNTLYKQVNWGIIVGYNTAGTAVYARKHPQRDVRSTYKKTIGGPRNRKPIKYLHLWERGYNSPKRAFAGHHFIRQTYLETRDEVRAIFKQRVMEMFKKAFSS